MEKRLTRSKTQRSIAGVCGGIAEYFDIDMTVVRLITVFLGLTGSGLLFYIAAWLIMPEA